VTTKKLAYVPRGRALEALCRRKGIRMFPPPLKPPPLEDADEYTRSWIREMYAMHAEVCEALEWVYYSRHGIRLPRPAVLRRKRAK
jgi:hypothetical protein